MRNLYHGHNHNDIELHKINNGLYRKRHMYVVNNDESMN